MKLLLLLPTLNEEDAIRALANEMPGEFEVLVVDGGSTDFTKEVALQHGWRFITQRYGNGKGCGIQTGMEEFLKRGHDHLGIIDADYTNDPGEVIQMLKFLKDNDLDVVLGNRNIVKQREYLGWFSVFINTLTSGIVSRMYGQKLSDIQTSYWVFNKKAVETIAPNIVANGFDIEYDLTYNAWKSGLKIGEVPVNFRRRIGYSKFHTSHRFRQIAHGLKYVYWSLVHLCRK
ncbi:MAG: glycosyltransferase family 2 protein [Methanosarcinales archaeon Met12]|nr:MAG: glycosyltransferase family 2 protein [Methanosarcinales archaeon Met12]